MIKLTQTLKIKIEYSRWESIPLFKKSDIKIIENSEYVASEITIRNDVYARSLKANNKANKINVLIKEVGTSFDLSEDKMNECLKDPSAQDEILNQRIEAQKKYKIESTPTIMINEKKYTNKIDYKTFKKIIEKNL